MSEFPCFLSLSNITLYIIYYILFSHSSISGYWIVLYCWILSIILLWILVYKYMWLPDFIYFGYTWKKKKKTLNHAVFLYLTFYKTTKLLFTLKYIFFFYSLKKNCSIVYIQSCVSFRCIGVISFLKICQQDGWDVISNNYFNLHFLDPTRLCKFSCIY